MLKILWPFLGKRGGWKQVSYISNKQGFNLWHFKFKVHLQFKCSYAWSGNPKRSSAKCTSPWYQALTASLSLGWIFYNEIFSLTTIVSSHIHIHPNYYEPASLHRKMKNLPFNEKWKREDGKWIPILHPSNSNPRRFYLHLYPISFPSHLISFTPHLFNKDHLTMNSYVFNTDVF